VVQVAISNPQVLTTTPGNRCGTGTVTLGATGSAGTTLNWYANPTGGAVLGTGNSFTTPSISTTTPYYVAAAEGSNNINTGRNAPQSASTGFNGTNYGLVFDATQSFTLVSVKVYPTAGAGSITVQLRSSSGTVLQTAGPFALPAGTGATLAAGATPVTINLNFPITPGTGYRLVTSALTGDLIRDNPISGFSYPSAIGSVGSITSGFLSGSASAVAYYFFYDWVVSVGCESARTAVNATVNAVAGLAATAGGPQVCQSISVPPAGESFYDGSCNLIARVVPNGGSPVSGTVNSCVTIAASVQTYNAEPYVQRWYDIEPATNAATATARVTLYYLQSEFDAYNAANGGFPDLPTGPADVAGIANLRITQFHGTGTALGNYTGQAELINPADANIVWNATDSRWEVTVDVTGFSGFFAHTTISNFPLPAQLVFAGEKQDRRNLLRWTTTSETNTKGFAVERATDGRNFVQIGYVPTQAVNGMSSANLYYNFGDDNLQGERQYYRLKVEDRDGRFAYTNVVLLRRGKAAGLGITSVYPNPVSRVLNIALELPVRDKVTLIVTDLSGKIMKQQVANTEAGVNTLQVDVSGLTAGTYIVKAVCSQGCEAAAARFVKQ
jgi:hypothetical protein